MRSAISNENDKPVWKWGKNGLFSVKTMYNHMCRNDVGANECFIWKAKLPLKIKIFIWLVLRNAIPTRDNLARRRWQGSTRCSFCEEEETILHLFFDCVSARVIWSIVAFVVGAGNKPTNFDHFWFWIEAAVPNRKNLYFVGLAAIIWAIWKTRNDVCFNQKALRCPTDIVCLASSFLLYWAGLHKGEDQEAIEVVAQKLKKAALQFHPGARSCPHEATHDDSGVVLLQ